MRAFDVEKRTLALITGMKKAKEEARLEHADLAPLIEAALKDALLKYDMIKGERAAALRNAA
jgi:hypothetical protein